MIWVGEQLMIPIMICACNSTQLRRDAALPPFRRKDLSRWAICLPMSVYLSVGHSIYLSICLSVCPSGCLSVDLYSDPLSTAKTSSAQRTLPSSQLPEGHYMTGSLCHAVVMTSPLPVFHSDNFRGLLGPQVVRKSMIPCTHQHLGMQTIWNPSHGGKL